MSMDMTTPDLTSTYSNLTTLLALTTIQVTATSSNISDNFKDNNSNQRPGGPPSGVRGGPPVDESYFVIPQETATLVRKVCYLGITPVMIFFGLIFNAICLLMFCKARPKTSTIVLLLTLTITDIVYNISAGFHALFVASGFYNIPFTVDQRIQAVPYFYSFVRPIPGRFGAVLTLLMSLERLLCVVKPIKVRQYSTKKTAIIAVSLLLVLTIGLSTPLALVNQTRQIYINATQSYIRIVEPTEFGKNTEVVDNIYLVDEIIFGFIPVVGVAISSSITAVIVARSSKLRSKLTSSIRHTNKDTQVTKTLLTIIFIFLICKIPAQTLGLIIFIRMKPYKYESNVYEVALAVTYIPLLANAFVNLFVYYLTSTKYRAKIKEILGCADNTRSSSDGQSKTWLTETSGSNSTIRRKDGIINAAFDTKNTFELTEQKIKDAERNDYDKQHNAGIRFEKDSDEINNGINGHDKNGICSDDLQKNQDPHQDASLTSGIEEANNAQLRY